MFKQPGWNAWKDALAWGSAATLGLRLGLGVFMALAWLAISPNLPLHLTRDLNLFGTLSVPDTFPGNVLFGVWVRWDAVHYLNLAAQGYFGVSEGDSVFYPLYPFLTRLVAFMTNGEYVLAGLIVSTLATLAAFTFLYRMSEEVLGRESAKWTVLALAIYPTALFLVAPFSESLFLALTLGGFLAAYKRHWWLAGALGFLASLARGPGMINAAVFAVIAIQQWRSAKPGSVLLWMSSVIWALAMPLAGGLAFLLWRSAAGFAPLAQILQQYSGLIMVDPFTGFAAAIAQWMRVMDFYTTLDLGTAILFLAFAGLMLIRPRWRRWDWLAYTFPNLILFLSKQSAVASSLQSISRYVLILFPVFMILGDWLSRASPRVRFLYITVGSIWLVVFSVLYSLWIFIG